MVKFFSSHLSKPSRLTLAVEKISAPSGSSSPQDVKPNATKAARRNKYIFFIVVCFTCLMFVHHCCLLVCTSQAVAERLPT